MKRYCYICASCFLFLTLSPFARAEKTTEWVEPIRGEVTDLFGTRGGSHKGLDIAAPEGESILAASEGVVTVPMYLLHMVKLYLFGIQMDMKPSMRI